MTSRLTNTQRKAIYHRDGWQCALCGSTRYLQLHHVIPRGQGGKDNAHNLITLCADCHASAHGLNLHDYPDITQADVVQLCVEYVADMYAGEWDAWDG